MLRYSYIACLVYHGLDVQLFPRSLGAYLSDNRSMNHQRRLKGVCVCVCVCISGFQPFSSCVPHILIFKIPLYLPSQNNPCLSNFVIIRAVFTHLNIRSTEYEMQLSFEL
jgi:hypothetical protein